jgi:hypothetical protein
LDAEISAAPRAGGPTDPAEALRAVARQAGLRLSVSGKGPRRLSRAGASTSKTAPARRVLALWNRPAQAQPNAWVAVYSRDSRSGQLYWFWGEGRRLSTILGRLKSGPPQLSWLMAQ